MSYIYMYTYTIVLDFAGHDANNNNVEAMKSKLVCVQDINTRYLQYITSET